jgi:hypothetical protein
MAKKKRLQGVSLSGLATIYGTVLSANKHTDQ